MRTDFDWLHHSFPTPYGCGGPKLTGAELEEAETDWLQSLGKEDWPVARKVVTYGGDRDKITKLVPRGLAA